MSSACLSKSILPALQKELDQFNLLIETHLINLPDGSLPIITPLLLGEGKRLRPRLAFLGGLICEKTSPGLRTYAMAIEFLHNASLLHDDIIDQTLTRRGKPSAHLAFGIPAALLAGNLLYLEAIQLVHNLNRAEITNAFLSTGRQLITGEYIQLKQAEWTNWDAYRSLAFLKAGALIESALLGGAKLAEIPCEYHIPLREYSYHLGILLQLTDDLIDCSLPKAANRSEWIDEANLHRVSVKKALSKLPPSPALEVLHMLSEELYGRVSTITTI